MRKLTLSLLTAAAAMLFVARLEAQQLQYTSATSGGGGCACDAGAATCDAACDTGCCCRRDECKWGVAAGRKPGELDHSTKQDELGEGHRPDRWEEPDDTKDDGEKYQGAEHTRQCR